MKTSLAHLPEYRRKEIEKAVQIIVETVVPEKVVLYGSHATGEWAEDRYVEGHVLLDYESDYDILVVTKAGDIRKDYEITDQIVNRCRYRVPVNVITHDIDFVNEQLRKGQYFFSDIVKEGILLYDAGSAEFEKPQELTVAERKEIAEADFNKWFTSAVIFLNTSNLIKETYNTFKESVFNLHQAAERTYNAIILVFNGYKPKTHNLDKLRHFTKNLSLELFEIFPRNTKEEEHLFDLLQKGYIDARYKDDYEINETELSTLIDRVRKMQAIVQKICRQKIASFEKN
jgi:HEPN domain-containing protein/predicted nucleotidyltransferase